MPRILNYYIGYRSNPQLGGYYVKYGQLTKTAAKAKEKCVYGSMSLTAYNSEEEYNSAIDKLLAAGKRIR